MAASSRRRNLADCDINISGSDEEQIKNSRETIYLRVSDNGALADRTLVYRVQEGHSLTGYTLTGCALTTMNCLYYQYIYLTITCEFKTWYNPHSNIPCIHALRKNCILML